MHIYIHTLHYMHALCKHIHKQLHTYIHACITYMYCVLVYNNNNTQYPFAGQHLRKAKKEKKKVKCLK